MASVLNVEWLNQNSQRAYPIEENMQRRPTIDGVPEVAYRVPNCAILDLVLATNFETQPRIYLSAFTVADNVVTAAISDASDDTVLAVVSAVGDDSGSFFPVNFSGSGNHDDIRGTIVFGDIETVKNALPDGVYRFSSSETMFEARCCRPSVPCVSGLFITDIVNATESVRLRGDVALVAGSNVRLDFDKKDNAIIINADLNYAYNDTCDCSDSDKRGQVLSINGISVSNVRMESGECVSVTTENGRIKISDTCSKPCCGCAELTFLNQKTNEITTAIGKLTSFSEELSSRLNEFTTNMLLSERSSMRYA